jgi:hypothetical protein
LRWIGELPATQTKPAASEPLPVAAPAAPAPPPKQAPVASPSPATTRQEAPPSPLVVRKPTPAPKLLAAEPAHPALPPGRRRGTWWGRAYAFLWVAFLGFTATLVVGVYGLGWNDPRTNRLLQFVPLPYALVRYHPIWYGTFRQEVAALRDFYRSREPDVAAAQPTDEEVAAIIVRRTMAVDLALSRGLWVSDAEVEAELDLLASRAGSRETVARTIAGLWQMDLTTYRARVLKPYLYKRKLLGDLQADPFVARQLGPAPSIQSLDQYLDSLRPHTPIFYFSQGKP